jgi:hypothetical protein
MTVWSTQTGAWAILTATASSISWHAAAFVLATLVVTGVLRLFNEWQIRVTLLSLVKNAPEGTVVEQSERSERQSMKVTVGPIRRSRRSTRT